MSNIRSHLDSLESLASSFDTLKDGQAFQKDQLIRFKPESKFHINFTDCFVAICPNGGLIAICKKHGFFDVKRSSTLNKNIIVMHQNTLKQYIIPIDWQYFRQYFVLFDFNEKEQLYGICNDATIFKIDICTQKAIKKFSSEILREEMIFNAKLYKDGYISMTEKARIYYIKDIKNTMPDLIISLEILGFSKNVEYLIIPEEVSKSNKMELLINNEKGNGLIHVETSDEGQYYITQLNEDDENNDGDKTQILGYNNISKLENAKLEPYITNIIEDPRFKKKNKKTTEVKNVVDNLGDILSMAISPTNKNIALYDSRGIVYFFDSTLDLDLKKNPRIKVKINLDNKSNEFTLEEQQTIINFSKNFQFLFCGEDTVVLYGLRIIFLVNKTSGQLLYKITDTGEEATLKEKIFAKLIQEIDGIRYMTDEGVFFISKVSQDLISICDPFSKSVQKKLLRAYHYFLDNSPDSEKTLREIINYLPRAINSLQIAAGQIFWTVHSREENNIEKKELQLFLLQVAQFGKVYLNVDEFNFDKFVEICKDIKCINNLRNHLKLPRMITYTEYKHLDSKDLIKKLMRDLNFGMALEMCHFLDYSDKKVYQRFAIAKIKKISKNINRTEEERLFDELNEKLKDIPNFSFVKLAKKAFKYHKNKLGMKFLEKEKSILYKVPQYIELKEWDKALECIEGLYDSNAINIILHKIYISEGKETFIERVSQHDLLESEIIDFLSKRDKYALEKYISTKKKPEEKIIFYLEKYFESKDLDERKEILNRAKHCIRLIENTKNVVFETKFYKNYIESLENNINFKSNKDYSTIIMDKNEDTSFDISIYDTNKIIIKELDDEKKPAFDKYNYKTLGFPQELLSMVKIITLCENKLYIDIENLLKKFSAKKLGLTNLNLAEIYYKFGKYNDAIEYIRNINDPFYLNYKIDMLTYIDKHEFALEVIITEKKVANIEDFINKILAAKPNLRAKAQELCEKYKVKLQLI